MKTKHAAHAVFFSPAALLAIGLGLQFLACFNDNFNNTLLFESIPLIMLVPQNGHPVPGNSGILSASVTSAETDLSWTRAADAETPQEDLQYRVYISENNDISTVLDAETNGSPVTPWTRDMTMAHINDLTPGKSYIINVIVKDGDGSKTAYSPVIITIMNSPVPGGSGIITTGAISASEIQLFWTRANDTETPRAELEYRLFRSDSNNIGTPADADRNGTPVTPWTADMATATAAGLDEGTSCFFNVIVRDGDRNASAYTTVSSTTVSDSIFMFSSGTYQGNLTDPASTTPRDDIDSYCISAKAALYPSLPGLNVRAFISISTADSIGGMPANYGVPTARKIVGPSGTKIADSWADLLDGTILEDLSSAGISSGFWWSGSNTGGTYLAAASCVGCNTCNGWTNGTSYSTGTAGRHNSTLAAWMDDGTRNCNNQLNVLCLCW